MKRMLEETPFRTEIGSRVVLVEFKLFGEHVMVAWLSR